MCRILSSINTFSGSFLKKSITVEVLFCDIMAVLQESKRVCANFSQNHQKQATVSQI